MHTVLVTWNAQEYRIEVAENETVYDACERQGLILPHGCLAGSCGACRLEVQAGKENLRPAKTIERNTLDALYRQARDLWGEAAASELTLRLGCRLKVTGEVKVEPVDWKKGKKAA